MGQRGLLIAVLIGVVAGFILYPKQFVAILPSPSTSESEWFMRVLGAPLASAGWQLEMLPGTPTPTMLQPKGVVIQWALDESRAWNNQPDRAATAEALATALKGVGISSTAIPGLLPHPRTMMITINERD